MPAYTFRCRVCGEVFTRRYGFQEDLSNVICPSGHTAVERVLHPPAIVFKGSGFYVTDHRGASGVSSSASKGAKAETQQNTTAVQTSA